MKETQIEAWRQIQDRLPASRAKVLRAIINNPGLTALELELFLDDRSAQPRITELDQQGMIVSIGTKRNPQTGLMAHQWAWSGSAHPKPLPRSQRSSKMTKDETIKRLVERIEMLEILLASTGREIL